MTVTQARRRRRDHVILIAAQAGCSQALLADVFDLPRSRIGAIVDAKRRQAESDGCANSDLWPEAPTYVLHRAQGVAPRAPRRVTARRR